MQLPGFAYLVATISRTRAVDDQIKRHVTVSILPLTKLEMNQEHSLDFEMFFLFLHYTLNPYVLLS